MLDRWLAGLLEECAVEHAETDGRTNDGDDPEADHDVDLAPANLFEVVVQWRLPEDALVSGLPRHVLDDLRPGDDDEEYADDRQQQDRVRGHGFAGDQATD